MLKRSLLKIAALLMIVIPCIGFTQPTGAEVPVSQDAQSLLSAFVAYADLRMKSVQQSVEILASTAAARSGKWKNMEALLTDYQRSDGGLIVWFVRPDGTYYTPGKGLMPVRLSDRSYFPGLISGGKVMGSLVISKATGQRSAIIAVPMKENGKVIGAIGVSLFLDRLSEDVSSALALRGDASFFALAPDGLTTLHRKIDRHFLDPRELGSTTLKKATEEILSNLAGVTNYEFDNATKTAIYRTSPLTHWKFVIVISLGAIPQN